MKPLPKQVYTAEYKIYWARQGAGHIGGGQNYRSGRSPVSPEADGVITPTRWECAFADARRHPKKRRTSRRMHCEVRL